MSRPVLDRSGYRALPLGDVDRFQQSSFGFLSPQTGYLFLERGEGGSEDSSLQCPSLQDTLEMVSEVELPVLHIGAGPSLKQPMAEGLLMALEPYLSEALVSHIGACYQFNVILPCGMQNIYFLDLTTGQGRVGCGVPDSIPDAVVEMAEADMQALLCRELQPLRAYMTGRLKLEGDLAVTMKLEAVLRALK